MRTVHSKQFVNTPTTIIGRTFCPRQKYKKVFRAILSVIEPDNLLDSGTPVHFLHHDEKSVLKVNRGMTTQIENDRTINGNASPYTKPHRN